MIYQWGMAVDDVIVVMLLVALMPYAISYRHYVRRIDTVSYTHLTLPTNVHV